MTAMRTRHVDSVDPVYSANEDEYIAAERTSASFAAHEMAQAPGLRER